MILVEEHHEAWLTNPAARSLSPFPVECTRAWPISPRVHGPKMTIQVSTNHGWRQYGMMLRRANCYRSTLLRPACVRGIGPTSSRLKYAIAKVEINAFSVRSNYSSRGARTPLLSGVLESKYNTPFQQSQNGGLWIRRLMPSAFLHRVLRCTFQVR